jgi:chaperonin cofactor prefoldin
MKVVIKYRLSKTELIELLIKRHKEREELEDELAILWENVNLDEDIIKAKIESVDEHIKGLKKCIKQELKDAGK